MDLKQLRSFLMVAECGSLSAASDRLRLAQPALSRQIRLLEAEIGFALFTRSTRGMVPTVRGAALFARVSGLVRQIDDSIDDIRPDAPQPKETERQALKKQNPRCGEPRTRVMRENL